MSNTTKYRKANYFLTNKQKQKNKPSQYFNHSRIFNLWIPSILNIEIQVVVIHILEFTRYQFKKKRKKKIKEFTWYCCVTKVLVIYAFSNAPASGLSYYSKSVCFNVTIQDLCNYKLPIIVHTLLASYSKHINKY